MNELILATQSDMSNITVNYYRFSSNNWIYCNLKFETEKEANEFLNKIKRDFNIRLSSVEKRVITYEKFVPETTYKPEVAELCFYFTGEDGKYMDLKLKSVGAFSISSDITVEFVEDKEE